MKYSVSIKKIYQKRLKDIKWKRLLLQTTTKKVRKFYPLVINFRITIRNGLTYSGIIIIIPMEPIKISYFLLDLIIRCVIMYKTSSEAIKRLYCNITLIKLRARSSNFGILDWKNSIFKLIKFYLKLLLTRITLTVS